ncbi:hypothetical protein GCM10025857_03830 [Alicyclobacillus contaminans]|uniref:flagellar biosynthetic protein FliO n=1 Tax=Alicyclobacillus contaminans TaxID=392016 RepID=UPI0003F81046|nr:flagellar biosynthetic protein FliO [Alicyclobacillus contaminans]GMA49026.1 hypothetical protein GCM10025857_03830 [Alicyclobacillus contaminans]
MLGTWGQVADAAPASSPSFPNPWVSLLELVLSLGIIILLVIVLIRFLARKSQVAERGAIQVLAARQLAPNKSIQVVSVEGRAFVLGVGNDVRLLAELTPMSTREPHESGLAGQPADSSDEFGAALADALRTLRQRRRGDEPGEEMS